MNCNELRLMVQTNEPAGLSQDQRAGILSHMGGCPHCHEWFFKFTSGPVEKPSPETEAVARADAAAGLRLIDPLSGEAKP